MSQGETQTAKESIWETLIRFTITVKLIVFRSEVRNDF
jgi:hypothetical protein